jgi:hypothetical protein
VGGEDAGKGRSEAAEVKYYETKNGIIRFRFLFEYLVVQRRR